MQLAGLLSSDSTPTNIKWSTAFQAVNHFFVLSLEQRVLRPQPHTSSGITSKTESSSTDNSLGE